MYSGVISNKLKDMQNVLMENTQYNPNVQPQNIGGLVGIVGKIQNAIGPTEEELELKRQMALEQNNRNNPNSGYSR